MAAVCYVKSVGSTPQDRWRDLHGGQASHKPNCRAMQPSFAAGASSRNQLTAFTPRASAPKGLYGEWKTCTRNRLIDVNGRRSRHIWSDEGCMQLESLWLDKSVLIPQIAAGDLRHHAPRGDRQGVAAGSGDQDVVRPERGSAA